MQIGPDTVSRAGPPSLRDARELGRRGRRYVETEEKGETPVYAKAYDRFAVERS